ncbi:MAG: hypothetical protein HY231_21990 [Acidobacteria bacterium]|nr:hypothetical protein [Acidobacteriota bacterium]
MRRKQFLQAGLLLTLFAALLLCQIGRPITHAQSGIEYVFDVVPDAATLSTLPATGVTFYLQGKVYPFRTVNQATCAFNTQPPRQLGTWRAWGTVADDGRLVINQSLVIDSAGGTIEIQGVTGVVSGTGQAAPAISGTSGAPFTGPTELLAVTGGVGVYRALNGEAQVRPYCVSDPTQPFRYDRAFCLGVIEGRRR